MKVTKHTNKDYSYITTERDKWYEWFRLEIEEGSVRRFYFPVEQNIMRRTTICWVWYLIPFILPIRLISVATGAIYRDTRYILNDWISREDFNRLSK